MYSLHCLIFFLFGHWKHHIRSDYVWLWVIRVITKRKKLLKKEYNSVFKFTEVTKITWNQCELLSPEILICTSNQSYKDPHFFLSAYRRPKFVGKNKRQQQQHRSKLCETVRSASNIFFLTSRYLTFNSCVNRQFGESENIVNVLKMPRFVIFAVREYRSFYLCDWLSRCTHKVYLESSAI